MDKTAKVIQLLKEWRKPDGDTFHYATVTDVYGDLCSVKIGDLELTDVRLKATHKDSDDYMLVTPAKNTMVVVCANNGDLRDLFVCKVDDPEKIYYKHGDLTVEINGKDGKVIINGGNLGGLIKIEELVNRFNAIEDYTKNLKTLYDSHVHPATLGNAPVTVSATTSLVGSDPTQTERDPLEDKNVTH